MASLKALRRGLVPPWLRYLSKSFRAYRKLAAVAADTGLPPLDPNPLLERKASDTLFILGSGSSVLSYSPEQWETISRHDSLGFNYWVLHPFVPTYYVFELSKHEWDLGCITRNLLARKDYLERSQICIKDAERFDRETVRDALRALPSEIRPLHLIWDAEIPAESPAELERAMIQLERLGGFSGGRPWAVPRNRATLFLAVNLAVRAGYKEIVLCGVDLNNTDYFFRMPEYRNPGNLCIPPEYQSGPVHKTNDPRHGEITISGLLDAFDRIVLQPRGIRLQVAKETSALYPRFKAYFS